MSASSPVVTGSPERSSRPLIRAVTERLQQTRQRVLRIRRLTALGVWAAVTIGVLATLSWTDYVFEWPFGVRAGAFATLLLGLGGSLWWFVSRSLAQLTLARTAVETESQIGEFGQRLRTTLDYHQSQSQPAAASPRLLEALQTETAAVAARVDWDAAIDDRPALLGLGAAALALVAWGIPLVLVPEYRTATARTLLWPAEYSQVDFSPREQTVAYGTTAHLEITISGRPLRSGLVRHRPVGKGLDWTSIDLAELAESSRNKSPESASAGNSPTAPATALTGTFTPRFEQLEDDLEIEVLAGPRALPRGKITVLQPLKLEQASAQITPPLYVGRPAETVTGLELRVLEGSLVDLRLELNRPASEAALIPLQDTAPPAEAGVAAPPPATIPLSISGVTLAGTLADVRHTAAYRVEARTADGMSLDSTIVRIRVQADRKPVVRFVAPSEELTVTPTTEVPIIAEASDDLGLHAVGIQYQVNDGELRTLWEGSGDGSTETLRSLATVLLEDLNVTFRDSIAYYAYAEDDYFGQPRRTTTELRFIDIRPYKVDYELANSQGGGGGGGGASDGSSASLEELIRRQRKNLVAAFAAQEEQPLSVQTLETLRQGEAELQQTTDRFAQALQAQFGPVPSLGKATAAMQSAVQSLGRQDVPGGVDAERQALAHLMQARENLRQLLQNSNSQQASACQSFDREFRQSLRLPERKKETPESRLAEARTQLQQLAQRERKWGQQARQSCSSPSASSSSSSSPSQSQTPSQNQNPNPNQTQPADPQQAAASPPSNTPPPASSPSEKGEPQSPAKSPSNAASASSPSGPSAEELAQAQAKLRQELADLKRQLADLKAAGRAAPQQADHADEAMQRGLEELAAGQGDNAAQAAEDSAGQIEELADHLAALATRDFGQRLDDAHNQARQLARAQADLARDLGAPQSSVRPGATNPSGTEPSPTNSSGTQSSPTGSSRATVAAGPGDERSNSPAPAAGQAPTDPARAQRQLATRMEMLAEVLDALRTEAAAESPALRRQLDTVASETPPDQIAAEMRQAAEALAAQRPAQAARSAADARDDLRQLAETLGTARGEFAQPQLQELLALEEQLAQLLKQAERTDEPRPAGLPQKWQSLADRLDRLAAGDRRLAEALDKASQPPVNPGESDPASPSNNASPETQQGSQPGGTAAPPAAGNPRPGAGRALPNGPHEVPPGHHVWVTLWNGQGAREIARVLQTKIQEAILAGALLDSDQPVPPQYKPLVEKYYKTLSDDLR